MKSPIRNLLIVGMAMSCACDDPECPGGSTYDGYRCVVDDAGTDSGPYDASMPTGDAGDAATPDAGVDASPPCEYTECDGECVDTTTSRVHCGECGNECAYRCAEGECDDPVDVTAGGFHTCVAFRSGAVGCWGAGMNGQLGTGESPLDPVPRMRMLLGLDDVVDVEAGARHTCARRAGGTVLCWGEAVLGDGTAEVSNAPVEVTGITDASQLAAGRAATCVRTGAGELWCWGGRAGNGSSEVARSPVHVGALGVVTSVDSGTSHVCAVQADGTAWCWGENFSGELGDGTTEERLAPVQVIGITEAVAVYAGQYFSCAQMPDALSCWGQNEAGQLGFDATADPTPTPTSLGMIEVDSVTLGEIHACALLPTEEVVCWGGNNAGQLGDGTLVDRPARQPVMGLYGARQITAGYSHTCALRTDGIVVCWGLNAAGQLGDGATENRLEPVRVLPPAE